MKIIVATPLYPPEIDRIASYSRQVAYKLSADHQVTVLAYGYKIIPEENLQVLVVDKTRPLFIRLCKYTWQLLKLAKEHDIVYVQNAAAVGLPAIVVKYLSGKPVVINFFEDEAYKRSLNWQLTDKSFEDFFAYKIINNKIKRVLSTQRKVLKHATAIVSSSNYLAGLLANKYKLSRDKIFLNYHPAYGQQKLPWDSKKHSHKIFAVGPFLKWSGLADIIGALVLVKEKMSDIELFIAGDGQDKHRLIKLARQAQVLSNIKFVGRISKAEYWHHLSSAKVYIHNFSGFDFKDRIAQAFLAKTLVLARDNDINQELLFDGQAGILFNGDSREDLADKILQILEDGTLWDKKISQATGILEANFSWSAHISRLNDIFAKLVK